MLVPRLAQHYERNNSETSVRRVVYEFYPDWKDDGTELKLKIFTQGITNTMIKIDHDSTSIVLRAFGPGAEPLTSRAREITTHSMFAEHDLAPPLLARFANGVTYSFTTGQPCKTEDLSQEHVWRGVARTLGKWHAILPIGAVGSRLAAGEVLPDIPEQGSGGGDKAGQDIVNEVRSESAPGDMWAVMETWAQRIPERDPEMKQLKPRMKDEVEFAFNKLGSIPGLGGQKLVMGHGDLLAGNILVTNPDDASPKGEIADVQFIDYEFSVACHAAFDIALHFGEWPGFECDYNRIPSPSTRKQFMKEYVRSWRHHRAEAGTKENTSESDDVKRMSELVDQFRGIPGLWFALWSMVQILGSSGEFDYREYGKMRLSEYFAWKGEESVLEVGEGKSDPGLREDKWFGRVR